MRKTAAEIADEILKKDEPSWLRRYLPLLVGVGAGGLGYGLSRMRRLSADPVLRKLQESATKNYYHTPYDELSAKEFSELPWYTKLIRRLHTGPEKVLEYDKRGNPIIPKDLMERIQKGEASLYDYRTQKPIGGHIPGWTAEGRKAPWGTSPKGQAVPDLEDKLFEMQLLQKHAPEAAIRSSGLADILRKNKIRLGNAASFRRLEKILAKQYPEGYFLKPRAGDASSGGLFASEEQDLYRSYRDWRKMRAKYFKTQAETERALAQGKDVDPNAAVYAHRDTPGYEGRVFEDLTGKGTMVQAKVPVAGEYRVHMVGGKAVPFTSANRFGDKAISIPSWKSERAAKWLEKQLQNLPAKYRGIPLAADIAPLEGGGYKVIEMNPTMASGMMQYMPMSGQSMYKHLTGRYTPEMSAIRGLGLGGLAAGATAGGQAIYNQTQK